MPITQIKSNEDDRATRLSCRVDSTIKRRAEQAAALLGQSMTGFTEAALSEKAEAILERNARIELTERDFERFVEAIAHPVPPTPELAAAMRNYDRQAASEPDGNW